MGSFAITLILKIAKIYFNLRAMRCKKTVFIVVAIVLSMSACSKEKVDIPGTDGTPANSGTASTPVVTITTIAGKKGDHGNAEDGNGASARFWNPTKMVY